MVIYASKPVGRILGYAQVDQISHGTPAELWAGYNEVGGISEDDFFKYFAGATTGVAISLNSIVVLQKSKDLRPVSEPLRPPQSYQYIDVDMFDRIAEVEHDFKCQDE